MKEQALKVAEWLRGLGNIEQIQPALVTITWKKKTVTYAGSRYRRRGKYTATMQAVTEGKWKEGETYLEEPTFYLIGARPESSKARNRHYEQKVVYRLAGDDGDWYVSSYWDGKGEPSPVFHPFGVMFQLTRWPHESERHGRMDRHDEVKRDRLDIGVEYV